jgi:hypothetical protein
VRITETNTLCGQNAENLNARGRDICCYQQPLPHQRTVLPISNSFRSSSAFARLRTATTTFVMSVCPSDLMEQLGSHWANIFDIRAFHENLSRKSRVSLKSDKNNTYFTRRRSHICDNILLNSTQNKKCFGWYLLRKWKQTFYVQ